MEMESPEIADDDYPGPPGEPCPAGYTDPGGDGVLNAVECDRCGAYVARGRHRPARCIPPTRHLRARRLPRPGNPKSIAGT